MMKWLERDDPFPPVETALGNPNGLLCAGADLTAVRLLAAYRQGIFPWYSGDEPILWWSPDPRMVLFCDELKIPRSLAKSVRNKGYRVTVDRCFKEVLLNCSKTRKDGAGTWLGKDMRKAYLALHEAGHAHSFETWEGSQLVGGLYGISIGRMFYGESMFTQVTDASKIALAHLVAFARIQNVPMLDCQQQTRHLASMGARPIPRPEFKARIATLVERPSLGPWPERLVWQRQITIDHNGNPG
jgi:leucyl/phenylalanyl-tRNA---protein transferase